VAVYVVVIMGMVVYVAVITGAVAILVTIIRQDLYFYLVIHTMAIIITHTAHIIGEQVSTR